MFKWPSTKSKNPDPELCDCTERTQVDGHGRKYWPRLPGGKPTGHHPDCEHYTPPPEDNKGTKP